MSISDPVGIPSWDLSDRLRKALRHGAVSVQGMADELGMSRKSVGDYINGRGTPKRPVLIAWSLKCGVPFEWLAFGIEPDDGPGGQVIDASGWFRGTGSHAQGTSAAA